jgi:hypothetical protein
LQIEHNDKIQQHLPNMNAFYFSSAFAPTISKSANTQLPKMGTVSNYGQSETQTNYPSGLATCQQ